jgi:Putative Ig domain
VVILVSGCLSDGSPSSAVQSARNGSRVPIGGDDPAAGVDNPPATSNVAPRIQGKPPRNVIAGQQYLFRPNASDPDGDHLTFAVHNLPAWANFDPRSGQIAGKPTAADVGSYKAIVVTVTDGQAEARLPEFVVAVVQTGDASVTLSWVPPTENTDGTPLVNLKGYEIHYGNASGAYSKTIPIDNPGITRYVIDGLGAGTYFFAVIARSASGSESDYSDEVSTTI